MVWKHLVVASLLLTVNVVHADETEATLRAYAAGYKAAFTCSGTFNAGKTLAQIKEHELTGIYPKIQSILDGLPDAVIDHDKRIVSVEYSDDMPPRIASWSPNAGCYHWPVGSNPQDNIFPYELESIKPHPTKHNNEIKAAKEKRFERPWKNTKTNPDNKISLLLAKVMTDKSYGNDARTSALLVATPTTILAEQYIDGFTVHTSQRTWSVAKSIGATLIGLGVQQGFIDVKAPATISQWQSKSDPRRHITLENLLHMASGLDSNRAGNRTDRLYLGGGRVTDTATTTALEAKPGTRWKYANNDTLLAVRALYEAKLASLHMPGKGPFPYDSYVLAHELFEKLGMHNTYAETDWEGNMVLSSQVWTTARDLARLGILHLQDGIWEGERILPEGWVKYISSPLGPQPPLIRSNGRPNPGYGAQWWLYNERFKETHPGIPHDTFAAHGNRGQFLVIIPSRDLVIVRRGYDMAGGEGFKIAKFIEDVLNTLDKT